MSFRIKTIHAFISIDQDDEEGVIGQLMPDGTWMPLICADEERLLSIRPMAEKIAQTGIKVKLVRFTQREDVEEIGEAVP